MEHYLGDDLGQVLLYRQFTYPDQVRWLYHGNWYDGPIDGRVVVTGLNGIFDSSAESLWATLVEQCDCEDQNPVSSCGFWRRYKLIRLKPEVDKEERRRQAVFEEFVGTHNHWSYGDDGQGWQNPNALKPKSQWHNFYDQSKEWPEWEPTGELVGWFEN